MAKVKHISRCYLMSKGRSHEIVLSSERSTKRAEEPSARLLPSGRLRGAF